MNTAALRWSILALLAISFGAGCGSESSETADSTGESATDEPAPEPAPEPEPPPPAATVIAERYLRSGGGEETAIRALLDPACHSDEAMTRVNAARVMGIPMTIEELTVTPQTETGDDATVAYNLSGSAHGEGGTTEILGMQVQTGEINVENASQSGTLRLRRIDGQWLVSCAATVAPATP